MSKLRTVIKHEYFTIVKQPSFWIIMLVIPLLLASVFALNHFGNKSSEKRVNELARELKNISIVDKSGLIKPDALAATGLTLAHPNEAPLLREAVRTEQKEALIVYPADIASTRNYDIYVSNNDLTKAQSVTALADTILKTSVFAPLGSADIIALAQNGAQSQLTTYDNGRETAGFNEYIVPGAFVILFYLIFAFSVGYMLTSISEEKENRSMEMVLTYVKPRTLIVGKLLAVSLVTLTQVAFFALLVVIAYIVASQLGSALILPAGLSFDRLVFDPVAIFFAASFLTVGFLMFAGFMTMTAAAAPSTREANSFSSVFFIGAFIPFYVVMLLLTDPGNLVTKFMTFFPLTSPVVTLIRNTVGNMGIVESILALLTMSAFMVLSIALAIRTFRLGALEFTNRLTLRSLFR